MRAATGLPVALIDEEECIGCTRCLDACPFDAIVGAAKLMHTVLADECTGCALCVPPCPVDCISLVSARSARGSPHEARAALPEKGEQVPAPPGPARLAAHERRVRERRQPRPRAAQGEEGRAGSRSPSAEELRAEVARAVARVRARRAASEAAG